MGAAARRRCGGRPVLLGLTVAGPQGVAHVLRLLRDEFAIALALTGCATPVDARRALIADGG